MDSESESISLMVSERLSCHDVRKKRTNETNARDFDSLNNLMLTESDAESIFSDRSAFDREDSLADDSYRSRDDTCSETLSAMRKHLHCADANMNSYNPKLRFKAEFEKHRTITDHHTKDSNMECERNFKLNSKKSIWKSFIALCIGLMFAFSSFMPLRNIQTSLYPQRHLGQVSLACMYFAFAIGCLLSPWITQTYRPKYIIAVAFVGHVVYCVANIYPSFYTLLPSSSFFGFFHAPLWTTQELLIASYAASYTAVTHLHIDKAIHLFQSVFLVFCHAAQVFGNLLESAILQMGDTNNSPTNLSLADAKLERDLYEKEVKVTNITDQRDDFKKVIWIGPFTYNIHSVNGYYSDKPNYENIIKYVFVSFSVLALTIICLYWCKPDIIVQKKRWSLCERMRGVLYFLPSGTFLALSLLILFSGMQQAIVIGNVTMLYGSLTLGLSMIGYMMMCYGTCQLAVLLLMEKFKKHLRASVLIFNAFLISLVLLVWLYIGQPSEDDSLKILGYVGLWGAADGLWQSQIQNVLLSWSTGRTEAAVTVFRTVQSLGLVLVFVLDIYIKLLNLICVCASVLVLGVILYLVLEVARSPLVSTEPSPIAL